MSIHCSLKKIHRRYGDCVANHDVSFTIEPGTIHALVGENGAGKSTAMRMIFGLEQPNSGEIEINGTVVKNWTAEKAFAAGLGMVHQHFMLAGPETVLDNLVLGVERHKLFFFRDRKTERQNLEKLMQETGLIVDLDATVDSLPIGLQSRCEILKVLYRNAKFLILDEPTAVLTPLEVKDFLNTLRNLKSSGHTILIVTHKLKEVFAVADTVTVLRAGHTICSKNISETSIEEISEQMVGHHVVMPKASEKTETTSNAREIVVGVMRIPIQRGRITGIAGVEGNGQSEILRELQSPSPAEMRKQPIAYIPADRHHEAVILDFSLTENLRLGREQMQHGALTYFKSTTDFEVGLLKKFDVRPLDPNQKIARLSGGNQQKVVIARELGNISPDEFPRSIVIAAHPTRGVDIGAIEFIHKQLLFCAEQGAAVLLISSELDELMALSNTIGVLYKNQIVGWHSGPHYNEQTLGKEMLGVQT